MLCDNLEGWEGGVRGRGHMYTYGCFMLMYGKNYHNIVKLLSHNLKKNLVGYHSTTIKKNNNTGVGEEDRKKGWGGGAPCVCSYMGTNLIHGSTILMT